MNALDGPRLKLEIAKVEIDKLERLVSKFVTDKKTLRVSFDRDPDTGEEVHVAHAAKPPDPAWGVHIGSIVHLIRSTLDNLAWQLALLNTPTPNKWSSYPIFLRRRGGIDPHKTFEGRALNIPKKGKNKGRLTGTIQSLSSRHRAMIERTQPYRRGNRGAKDPLWLLHELNNSDKHRTITLVVMGLRKTDIRPVLREKPLFIGFQIQIRSFQFEEGVEVARFPGPVKVKPQYSAEIRFGKEYTDLSVIKTMRSMHSRVVDIIESFVPEFGSKLSHGALPLRKGLSSGRTG